MREGWRTYAMVAVLACAAFFAAGGLVRLSKRYEATHGPGGGIRLDTEHAVFAYRAADGAFFALSKDGTARYEGKLVVAYAGVRAAAEMQRPDDKTAGVIRGDVAIAVADVRVDGTLELRADAAADTVAVSLGVRTASGAEDADKVRLVFETTTDQAFVPGVGVLADAAMTPAPFVVMGEERPLAVDAAGLVASTQATDGGLRVSAETEADTVRVTLGTSSPALFSALFARGAEPIDRVAGVVHGISGAARVVGLDEEGAPRVRFTTGPDGRFEVRVPLSVTSWYASALGSAVTTSAPSYCKPGAGFELALDVSEGGELEVHVTDADTHAPLTARLLVHGIEGTLDPTFGPDYRASGAGPIIDALRGAVTTPLPKGKYRVAATKGIEWSIDAKIVDVASGKRVVVDLAPRHVVPTPGVVGCDLHVHARPSFDSPVLVEDRVLSLVAAGVDFAIPTEHNIVGDYGPSLEVQGLSAELASVHGVEVTTYSPRFGHFGLFPYPLGTPVPTFRNTTADKLFAAARAGDPNRVLQVNHPRLPKQIGYFETSGFVPGGPIPKTMRTDFDAIEVYNGYDLAVPSRVEAVMSDWFALLNAGLRPVATGSSDSHRIQYQWAGYPRTLVAVGDVGAGDDGSPVDPARVVAAIRKGHATVSSGPIIDLQLEGARPGDAIPQARPILTGRVVVRAAPWVDVTSLDVVVGGKVVETLPVPGRTTSLGPELGSKDEAQARTVRLDAELRVKVTAPSWVIVVARGTRLLDDVLPFMPVPPLAFTNPVWVGQE